MPVSPLARLDAFSQVRRYASFRSSIGYAVEIAPMHRNGRLRTLHPRRAVGRSRIGHLVRIPISVPISGQTFYALTELPPSADNTYDNFPSFPFLTHRWYVLGAHPVACTFCRKRAEIILDYRSDSISPKDVGHRQVHCYVPSAIFAVAGPAVSV